MPSIASHFAVAKIVSQKLNTKTDNFYKGNILPDIIDKKDSHLKIKGSYYEIPDIELFENILNYDNDLELGYMCHLLLDKYFLEEYVINNVKNYKEVDPFLTKKMYNDYTKINYKLVSYFNLDVDYINKVMSEIDLSLDVDKLNSNINSINMREVVGELECLDLKNYIVFLEKVSFKIAEDLKEKR